jgi:predicted  nucleic acid-binding Zn-ribbon protein
VERYIKKSLHDAPLQVDTKYRICSKCGATIPQDMKICKCGAEYSSMSLQGDYTAVTHDKNEIILDDATVEAEFSALKDSLGTAEGELEKIAEEIAVSVKGDIKKKEQDFETTAQGLQDMILRLQQEVSGMKMGFNKIAENIANEVRDEIKKHEDGKITAVESRIKDTLDKLQIEMKKEGASLKEEDSKIRTAKKELYDEVNKLMDRLKKNEKEIIEREKLLAQKEIDLEKKSRELDVELAKKETEIVKKRAELESQVTTKSSNEYKKASDAWKTEEARLNSDMEKTKKINDELKKQEIALKTELEQLRKESENWKKEETKLKSIISNTGAVEDGKYAEITKMQSKILVAILKENPNTVLNVIKALNISKEDLKKLLS